MTRWFARWWWSYLLDGCSGPENFVCRVRGHPYGIVWFNVGGTEPDMHCKNCGEDLG